MWKCGEGQTDRHTAVANIHFASATPHAKCNQAKDTHTHTHTHTDIEAERERERERDDERGRRRDTLARWKVRTV